MADVSHSRGDLGSHPHATGDLGSHPDVPEMQARYAQMLGGGRVMPVEAPVFLVGLYCAASPWILHFTGNQSALATHNLIMGIAIGLMALAITIAPGRMMGLGGAMSVIGVWMIIAPWIVGSNPDRGIIWNNAVIGGLTILLGLLCAGVGMRAGRRTK
ncbi:SPW repeat protein [Streptomyces sp. NBC_00344]|uniref:SPW repeat protein n=1 Tax=Streptomyces sp. NBC_00344 TaxID=2975720 RepID=UPI002E1ADAE1